MKQLSFCFILLGFLAFGQQYSQAEKTRITEGEITTALPIIHKEDVQQHKVLLAKSTNVKPRNRYTKILVNRMKLALLSTKSGVGIAAPQVGINRNIIWVQRFDLPEKPLNYFLNPVITWKSEILNLGPEGDLSIEDFRDRFYRSKVIQLDYEDLNGKKHTEIIEGFTAVIVQHEIDHLFGILISDKIKEQNTKNFQPVQTFREVAK